MMGADEGTLLSDRKFAGADVLATSYTLSQGVMKLGKYDLIICGKQTTDGDTARVGPEMAEYLDIPHVANVTEIVEIKDESVVVKMNMANTIEVVDIKYPCLITVEKDIMEPRLPSYKTVELSGLVSGEHGIGYAKRKYMFEQYGDQYMAVMRGIKAAFDPKNILNPGKVCQ